jgi:hypothetical protein
MYQRRHERVEFFGWTVWDFFTAGTGRKDGWITDISRGGCLLKTNEPIEHRRWIRLIIAGESGADGDRNVRYSLVGRVIRRENVVESVALAEDVSTHRYGIEFTFPSPISDQDFALILALSSRNLSVRSCRSLNEKSSLRPGFLS